MEVVATGGFVADRFDCILNIIIAQCFQKMLSDEGMVSHKIKLGNTVVFVGGFGRHEFNFHAYP